MVDAAEGFAQKFAKSEARAKDGRAQRVLPKEQADLLKDHIDPLMPKDLDMTKFPKQVLDILQPSIFGIAKGQETASTEMAHFQALRITVRGVRSFLAARTLDVLKFGMSQGNTMASITPKRLFQIFKSMNGDALAKMTGGDKGELFHGTIGPCDGIYLPTGWVFAERTMKGTDVIGLRVGFVRKADRAQFEELNQWLLQSKKPSDAMQKALDVLTLAAA